MGCLKRKLVQAKSTKTHLPLQILLLLVFLSSIPAFAHHPWESDQSNLNVFQGFLSGIAHPVLGFDHLLFLASVGLVSTWGSIRRVSVLVFIGLSGAICSQSFGLFPASELVMSISLIASALVALKIFPSNVIPPLIFAHGYVLGNAMIGVEPTPLISYFLGLLVSQTIIVFSGVFFVKRFWKQRRIFINFLLLFGVFLTTTTILDLSS